MISPEKLAANQANSQHSTGPRTAEGKAASSQNSRTHALCSKERLVANEDQHEFEALELSLVADVGPQGVLELTLFNELLTSAWQLRRILRMETELSAGHDTYTALLHDEILQKKLDRLGRHHTRFERTFHRSLKELKALQAIRAQREEALQENLHRPHLAPASTPKTTISKRTQLAPDQEADEALDPEMDAMLDRSFAELAAKYEDLLQKISPKAA